MVGSTRKEPAFGTLGFYDIGVFIEGFRPFPRAALTAIAPNLAQRNLAYWEDYQKTGEGLHPRMLPIRAGQNVPPSHGIRVIFCLPNPHGGLIQLKRTVGSYDEILEYDLEHMKLHPESYVDEHDSTPRMLVCTHGKVDPCCAVFGNALYRAIGTYNVELWHGAHFGGCRFAGNLWSLTSGNCYGHVSPAAAGAVVKAELEDCVFPSGFRGRIGQTRYEAAAEYLVRFNNNVWVRGGCTLLNVKQIQDAEWIVEANVNGDMLSYRLRAVLGDKNYLTCQAKNAAASLRYSIEPLFTTSSSSLQVTNING